MIYVKERITINTINLLPILFIIFISILLIVIQCYLSKILKLAGLVLPIIFLLISFYGAAKAQYWLFVDKEYNFLVLLVLNIPTILFMAIYIYYKKRNEKSSIMKSK